MPAHMTEKPGWVYTDDGKGHGLVPGDLRPRSWSPFITWAAENTGNATRGPDRRGRAVSISAARRAWLKANPGHMLFLVSQGYDETWGFLHQSRFRYRVIPCDAVTGGRPATNCSANMTEIWYGHATPALACGYHARYFMADVHSGHVKRTEHDNGQAARAGGRPGHDTWPYKP